MQPVRTLVVGGTGFLGSAACKELMRRGIETIAASRSPHPFGTFTSHRVLDRRDRRQLQAVLEETRPDVLLDLACYQPDEVESVLSVFRGGRYVFVSTGVYPDLNGRPAREDDFRPYEGPVPAGELSYLEGKRWCETVLARNPGLPWIVVRPPAILGAGDHTLRIAAYIQRVEDGGPLLVPVESYRRQAGLAWVKDVGFACALACDTRKSLAARVYNVAFEGVSLEALISGIGRAMNRQVRMVAVPYAELPPGASPYGPDPRRPAGYVIDRARRELGFDPSALEEALAETLAWHQTARPSHPGYSGRAEELRLADSLQRS